MKVPWKFMNFVVHSMHARTSILANLRYLILNIFCWSGPPRPLWKTFDPRKNSKCLHLTVMLLLYPLQILAARAWLFFHSMLQNFAAWGLGIWPFGKIFKCGVNLNKYSFFDVILGCHIVKGLVVHCMNINLQIICEAFRLACDQTFSKIRLGLLNWNWTFGYFSNIFSTWFLYTGGKQMSSTS